MTTTVDYADVAGLAGTDLGYTDWLEVTQDRVNLFADATDDHQWIHVDPERAAEGPFGAPIAHGFLTLSLDREVLDGAVRRRRRHHEGQLRPRQGALRLAGQGRRARAHAAPSSPRSPRCAGGYQFAVDQTIEIEGADKPAVVARGLYRFYA